jgi:hypothetical protein
MGYDIYVLYQAKLHNKWQNVHHDHLTGSYSSICLRYLFEIAKDTDFLEESTENNFFEEYVTDDNWHVIYLTELLTNLQSFENQRDFSQIKKMIDEYSKKNQLSNDDILKLKDELNQIQLENFSQYDELKAIISHFDLIKVTQLYDDYRLLFFIIY